jgi:hypothetical protein
MKLMIGGLIDQTATEGGYMKRMLLVAAIVLVLAPESALASTPSTTASASCKAQLKASGQTNFDQLYKSMGVCVSQTSHKTNSQRQALLSAEKRCRTEQNAGKSAFETKYGTNGKKNNAFGKCVSHYTTA